MKKDEQKNKAKELSLDKLDEVVGGAGLRDVAKTETKPISADTKRKI